MDVCFQVQGSKSIKLIQFFEAASLLMMLCSWGRNLHNFHFLARECCCNWIWLYDYESNLVVLHWLSQGSANHFFSKKKCFACSPFKALETHTITKAYHIITTLHCDFMLSIEVQMIDLCWKLSFITSSVSLSLVFLGEQLPVFACYGLVPIDTNYKHSVSLSLAFLGAIAVFACYGLVPIDTDYK